MRADEETWYRICKAAHQRGMMRPVRDEDLYKDVEGHYVVNGAGGVSKKKFVDGQEVDLQRFISILVPTNEHSLELPGEQDSLPYVGQLTGILLDETSDLYMYSEDFTSAFNLFRVPESWSVHFAFAKKVKGSAFGGSDEIMVRPAMAVIPMGWKSAVTLVQAAVRHIVFDKAKVPRESSVEKGRPLPETKDGKSLTVIYLDNYDELRCLKRLSDDSEKVEGQSEGQKNFNKVCDAFGLERNLGKQLIGSFSGAIQGGELNGKAGIIKVAPDKLKNFIGLSVGLLFSEVWQEFPLRHWTGKAAFVAAFRRPLFSVLQEVFDLIQMSVKGDVKPTREGMDELMVMCFLSVQAETSLRATISKTVSCTDASPTGGGSCEATRFKDTGFDIPPKVEASEHCGQCEAAFQGREESRLYPCPRNCGARFCKLSCAWRHNDVCVRKQFFAPKFGERFCGPNYPLSKAMGLAGLSVQEPLDKLRGGAEWEFFSDEGKEKLDEAEGDASLQLSHWAPNCRTFSRARGRPIWLKGKGKGKGKKGKVKGPQAVRSEAEPWGISKVSKDDAVKVRQDNKMARRALRGLKEGHSSGRFVSLEHPYSSYLWNTDEAKALMGHPGFFVSEYSHCCYGGRRVKWTRLLHNVRALHEALHKPVCEGHPDLLGYQVHQDEEGNLNFDTAEEAEYPWEFCKCYAAAAKAEMLKLLPAPVGSAELSLQNQLFTQIRGATRGLQDEGFVKFVCDGVLKLLETMNSGQEEEHLRFLMRHVGLRGTDVRITVGGDDLERREALVPYPAFRWYWKTILSYQWAETQHINVLEATAVLAELRRRVRDPTMLGKRFINIIDSMVVYFALTKGRSGSKRLNRTLRRIMAISLASRTTPVSLWTLSKWNFADKPSRRFEKTSK